jgi:flagellar biosynthesis repressor protein FlbT
VSLKIRLAPDERIVINGALIQADGRCSLVFLNNCSFLTEKHIMRPAEANTPARRIYFMTQNSYMATDAERPPLLATLRDLVADFRQATTVESIRDTLDQIRELVDQGEYYPALKLTEVIMRHEDRHLGNPGWMETRRQAEAARREASGHVPSASDGQAPRR